MTSTPYHGAGRYTACLRSLIKQITQVTSNIISSEHELGVPTCAPREMSLGDHIITQLVAPPSEVLGVCRYILPGPHQRNERRGLQRMILQGEGEGEGERGERRELDTLAN